MDTKWLEDFISLAETQSFSRSAQLRHVTQPAFSRRIQSLEAWLGTDLIDRTAYPTRLTTAGKVFYEQALEVLGKVNNARSLLLGKPLQTTIDFAVPHNLSLTYIPKWLTAIEENFGRISARLMALNVHDAVMTLVEGGCDLLVCYYHPLQPLQLDPKRYDMITLGMETLRPYTACDKAGVPKFLLPGTVKAPLPYLSYTINAYLGRMVELILANVKTPLFLEKYYETDMAEGLKMMALEGRGIAFLPQSAVVRELKQKLLAPADGGRGEFGVDMEIRVYRERALSHHVGKPLVSQLWDYLLEVDRVKQGSHLSLKNKRKNTP